MATGRIGTTPVLQVRWSKAPTNGTTSLSGLDDNSVSLVYSVGYEAVYRNGVLLSRGNDYTATDGTTVTLIDATITGDIIEIFANQTIPLSDTYSQTVSDGKFINNTLTTTTGDIIYASGANTPARLAIGTSADVLTVSGGIPAWAAPAAPSYVGAQAALSASGQSISYTSGVETIISFGSENFDTDGFHSTSTNTSRMTIPSGKGGKYLFTGTLFLNTVPNYARLTLAKNGTFIREVLSYGGRIGSLVNAGSGNEPVIGNMITTAAAADYFELAIQTDVTTGTYTAYGTFTVTYLGA
jgi:hypothetical protein